MLQRKLVSARPEFVQLPAGWHRIKLANVIESDSFTQYNGTPKEKTYGWTDPCPQLIMTMVSAVKGIIGGITHRFNLLAYLKFDKLTEKQVASGKFHDINGYACVYNKKDDTYTRIIDDKGVQACDNILNQALYALGIPEGFVPMTCQDEEGNILESDFPELLASGKELTAEILVAEEADPNTGNIQLRVTKWRRPKIEAKALEVVGHPGTAVME